MAINKFTNTSAARQGLYEELRTMSQTKSGLVKILAYVYSAFMIVAMMAWGATPALYLSFALLSALFILPGEYFFGLSLIIVLTMVFERFFTLQGLTIDKTIYKFYLLDIVICLSYLALFINRKIYRQVSRIVFGWPEKLLIIWLIITGVYLVRSFYDINADFAIAFSSFKNYFFYPLLYFFIIFAIDNGKKLKDTVHLMLLTAVGIIAFIFIGFINGQGLWTEFTPLSTVGTRYLAGTHAFYLTLAIAMSLPLLLYKRLRNIYFALAVMGFWIVGIAVSLMRHLWLALLAALFATLILLNRELKKIYVSYLSQAGLIMATILAVIILASSLLYFQGSMDKIYTDLNALSSRIATVTDISSDTSIAWRQDVWQDAGKVWIANPVFGAGFGHSMLVDSGTYQTFEEIRNIHNSPLSIAVQMGLIGLASFLAFIIAVIISSINKIYKNEDLKPYYIGILAAISVYLAACLFQPYLETNMMGIWLWILLGLLRTSSIKKS